MAIVRVWFTSLCAAAACALLASPAMAASLTPQQMLGKALFFDKSLSHNGNQSCASCHSPSASFTDPNKSHPTSQGDNPALFGSRNAPTAGYAAFSPEFHFDADQGLWVGGQFLDGRAATLEDQARAPFLGGVEMGNANRAEVISRLMASSTAILFGEVYGPSVFNDIDDAFNKIADAIASYERSEELSPFSSKYDYFLKGQIQLTDSESRGLDVFNDPMKGNCAACHISTPGPNGEMPLFTDFTYDNIGIAKNFASDFLHLPVEFNPDGENFIDLGLGAKVDDPGLYGAFKVSTLRNVALTAPYGHNGYFNSLEQVVDFYATRDVKPLCANSQAGADEAEALGCWALPELPMTMNVDELGNLPLTADDKYDLVAFLRTLTDGFAISAVPESSTWMMMILGFGLVGGTMRRRSQRDLLARS